MRHRPIKLAVALAAILTCSLVTSTTFAYYRVSIGPKRCCTTHCRHAMPKRPAEQCCRAHPEAAPAAVSKIAPPDATAPVLFVATATAGATLSGIAPCRSEGRAPPGRTLLAQYTSLAL